MCEQVTALGIPKEVHTLPAHKRGGSPKKQQEEVMIQQQNYENVLQKGVLVLLKTSVWTGRVKMPSKVLADEGVNPDFVRAYKYLIDPDCMKDIVVARNKARDWLYNHSLPFPIKGVVLIPISLVPGAEEKLGEFKRQFQEAVMAFTSEYNAFIESAQRELGPLYNPSEYPRNIHAKFNFGWGYFTLATPDHLSAVDPALVEREQRNFQNMIQEFQENAINALREKFLEMISNISDRLKTGKKWHKSSVEKFKEFLENFQHLNIADDQQLAEAVEKSKSLLKGIPVDELRSRVVAEVVGEKLEEVKDWAVANLEDLPRRKVIAFRKTDAA